MKSNKCLAPHLKIKCITPERTCPKENIFIEIYSHDLNIKSSRRLSYEYFIEVNFDAEHLEYIPDGDIVVVYVLESNPEYVFDYAMLGEERIETKTIVLTSVTEDMSLSVFFKATE